MTPGTGRSGGAPMDVHVDLIETDWHARVQRCVAKFVLGDEEIEVEGTDADVWRRRLLHPITDPKSAQPLDPASAPKDWLDALHYCVHGSYLVATVAHGSDTC